MLRQKQIQNEAIWQQCSVSCEMQPNCLLQYQAGGAAVQVGAGAKKGDRVSEENFFCILKSRIKSVLAGYWSLVLCQLLARSDMI